MAFDIKKVESRLQNIKAVTPVLSALRTISLGSWRMAIARSESLDAYTDRLLALLPYLLPHLSTHRTSAKRWLPFAHRDRQEGEGSESRSIVTMVMGSERGLCGQYNSLLIDQLASYLPQKQEVGTEVSLIALGSRLIRELQRAGHEMDMTRALSVTRLPSYELAREFVDRWLADYESHTIDAVDLVYNSEAEAGTYKPTFFRLIPPSLPTVDTEQRELSEATDVGDSDSSKYVIIESNPVGIYTRIIEAWTITTTYKRMLEAASTEHAARYQLMESATQNADELIDKLTRDIKTGRRREITQEMQELAVAAGLLKG